jgi:hypothetical protein
MSLTLINSFNNLSVQQNDYSIDNLTKLFTNLNTNKSEVQSFTNEALIKQREKNWSIFSELRELNHCFETNKPVCYTYDTLMKYLNHIKEQYRNLDYYESLNLAPFNRKLLREIKECIEKILKTEYTFYRGTKDEINFIKHALCICLPLHTFLCSTCYI